MQISVIICTYNPLEKHLTRVLQALQAQTLPMDQWELLLVDNASQISVADRYDLSWHPNGRHIREEQLGLTPARLRGIKESRADILAFVDDDNVLASDYLEQALLIGEHWPFVGVWGGSIGPEFEVSPPSWIWNHSWRLAIVDVKEDIWSNLREGFETKPAGAGMCVRKAVAARYLEWCRTSEKSNALGRKGKSLSGYEDIDLEHCALDIGLGTGKFTRLRLTHLIPASRLTLDYFIRQAEGDATSLMMFRAIRGLPIKQPKNSLVAQLKWHIYRLLSRKSAETIKIQEAHMRGLKAGWKRVQEYKKAQTKRQIKI